MPRRVALRVRWTGAMTSSSLVRALGLIWLTAALGCALTPRGMARDIASASPPAAISSTLRALNDDENQRLMIQLMASPEMHAAAREFAGEVADGALTALTEPERVARIEAMSTRYVATLTRAVSRSMAEGMRRDLGPAIAEVMRQTVASTMREALREGYQRDMERMVGGITRVSVEAASRGMAEGIGRDLVPALRTALLDEQTSGALAAASRSLAREVVLGSNDAMTHVQRQQERTGRPSFLARVSDITQDGVKLMQLVAVVAVALSLMLGAWVLRLVLRGRRLQAESERHAASAVTLAEAIRAAEGKPWSQELTELLHERMQGAQVAGVLDEVLRPRAVKKTGKKPWRPSPPPVPAHGDT